MLFVILFSFKVSASQREVNLRSCCRFRRTIYLCSVDSVEKQAEKERETENQKRMCSWGHKFEQFMTDGE